MGLQDTPRANRPHIGLFGNRNAGKSSLLNAITGQAKSLVSPVAGTTTDLVYQTFELERLGPVVFIDTAGLDDSGPLGTLRVEKTRQAVDTMDLAILVLTGPMKEELSWFQWLQEKKIPILPVLNQCDRMENVPAVQAYLSQQLGGLPVLPVSAKTGEQIPQLRQAIAQALPDDFWELTITGSLAQPGDLVLLVMPQDLQAPKGRLILPQVQTMRELLDKRCSVMSCTADCLESTLETLRVPPKLIITDSQVFPSVWKAKPAESLLTSFSILFAGYKGDQHRPAVRYLDKKTRKDFFWMLAEAWVYALDGEYSLADSYLADVQSYLESRNYEICRRWQILFSFLFTCVFGIFFTILFVNAGVLSENIKTTDSHIKEFCYIAFGSVGALFSILCKTGKTSYNCESGRFLNALEIFCRILASLISAFIVLHLFKLDLVFSAFKTKDHLNAALIIICFMSGFSERLIPSLINS